MGSFCFRNANQFICAAGQFRGHANLFPALGRSDPAEINAPASRDYVNIARNVVVHETASNEWLTG